MVNIKKVHSGNINAKNFNYLLYTLLLIAGIGSVFQEWNGINAGIIYTSMIALGAAFITYLMFTLKDDDKLYPLLNYVRIPISTKLTLACLFYVIGFITPFILNLITEKIFSFSIVQLSVPFFGAGKVQTFAAATIESSISWEMFNIFFVAGTVETILYNFLLIIFFIPVALLFLKLWTNGKDLPFMKKETFVKIFILGIVTILFILSHVMNGSYEGIMFIIAGIFLLIGNYSIYTMGIFLMFWLGYHQGNNLLALIIKYTLLIILNGFISWFGAIFLLLFVSIIYFILKNHKQVIADFKWWWHS